MGYPPVIKHRVLEDGPFISDFPNKRTLFSSGIFQLAMFDYQRVVRVGKKGASHPLLKGFLQAALALGNNQWMVGERFCSCLDCQSGGN